MTSTYNKMKSNSLSAISTAVIAFVTIIGLMFGFYYNLKIMNVKIAYISMFELFFVISIWLFTSRIKEEI